MEFVDGETASKIVKTRGSCPSGSRSRSRDRRVGARARVEAPDHSPRHKAATTSYRRATDGEADRPRPRAHGEAGVDAHDHGRRHGVAGLHSPEQAQRREEPRHGAGHLRARRVALPHDRRSGPLRRRLAAPGHAPPHERPAPRRGGRWTLQVSEGDAAAHLQDYGEAPRGPLPDSARNLFEAVGQVERYLQGGPAPAFIATPVQKKAPAVGPGTARRRQAGRPPGRRAIRARPRTRGRPSSREAAAAPSHAGEGKKAPARQGRRRERREARSSASGPEDRREEAPALTRRRPGRLPQPEDRERDGDARITGPPGPCSRGSSCPCSRVGEARAVRASTCKCSSALANDASAMTPRMAFVRGSNGRSAAAAPAPCSRRGSAWRRSR